MKRIRKSKNSIVLKNKIKYKVGRDNSILRRILEKEQKYVCAYSEERITPAFSVDVEHFNPHLKGKASDNYTNWFAVSTKINRIKNKKWNKYQPVLHPTAKDFEKRIWYDVKMGVYEWDENDIEAYNLSKLININSYGLVQARRNHIKLIENLLSNPKNKSKSLVDILGSKMSNVFQYYRAVETAFPKLKL